jgi:ketosteroid isomerase-like protein
MSQENVEVVRQPFALRAGSRRRLAERVALRYPRPVALLARGFSRLHVRSRLRQAIVRRAVQLGIDAVHRGDYEAMFALYHPDIELINPPQFVGLGLDLVVRGREERIRFQRRWHAEWGEVRYEPEEVIDLGDRVLMVGRIKGSGLGSGAAFESEWGNLLTLSAGRVIGERPFTDRGEALKAAGLSE